MSKNNIAEIKEFFLRDTKNHKVEILNDNGNNRTLCCSNNGSCYYKFYITTWNGYLCVSGDIGVWVFSRLPDMFEFFRGKENPDFHYWSEKLEGGTSNSHSLAECWDADLFIDQLTQMINERDYDPEETERLLELARNEIFPKTSYEAEAVLAIFDCDEINEKVFGSYYEHDLGKQYHHRFVWVCFAIVWAIKEYDKIRGAA
ncbi:MAG: hypothetical protein AB7U85_04785 [Alphaproteobacteria bacterium]